MFTKEEKDRICEAIWNWECVIAIEKWDWFDYHPFPPIPWELLGKYHKKKDRIKVLKAVDSYLDNPKNKSLLKCILTWKHTTPYSWTHDVDGAIKEFEKQLPDLLIKFMFGHWETEAETKEKQDKRTSDLRLVDAEKKADELIREHRRQAGLN